MREMLLLIVLLLPLGGCAFSYIPLIPEAHVSEPPLELRSPEGLVLAGDTLRLSVQLLNQQQEGWLAVQWYGPGNREVASDSLWVRPDDTGRVHHLYLPGDVTLRPGQWRAVVSFAGQLLRQFSLQVPAS
jgi:hypothetical protein